MKGRNAKGESSKKKKRIDEEQNNECEQYNETIYTKPRSNL